MEKFSEAQQIIKELRTAATAINNVADALAELVGNANEDKVVPVAEPTLSLEEVRAVLADKSRLGFTSQVRELLQKYGASKLSGIDPSNYNALLKDAEVLGNG